MYKNYLYLIILMMFIILEYYIHDSIFNSFGFTFIFRKGKIIVALIGE
jgi:hypothetical protein